MPLDPESLEKIQKLQTDTALNEQSIERLEAEDKLQWQVIEKIKESLSTVKVQIAGFGVINTLIAGWIAYKLTKGAP